MRGHGASAEQDADQDQEEEKHLVTPVGSSLPSWLKADDLEGVLESAITHRMVRNSAVPCGRGHHSGEVSRWRQLILAS